MVTVTVADGDTKSLAMLGHANFSPGDDIVCAACSALVFALLAYMEHEPAHIFEVMELTCEKGDVRIEAVGDDAFAAAFETVVYGLAKIAEKYPKHVQIIRT
jgi:uncharacterized protein YsxB (DUF464 family)